MAVRLPKEMIRHLALKEGNDVVLHNDKDVITIRRQEPQGRSVGKNEWRKYLMPTKRKKENVSGNIDRILYGAPR